MKKSRKFLSLLCALCMTMALAAPAFAAEEVPATEPVTAEQEITTRAATIPTEQTDLPYTASTSGLAEGAGTYTKYYFQPSGTSLTLSGTFTSSGDQNNKSRNAKIYLYEVGNSSAVDSFDVGQFLGSATIDHTFSNLKSTKNYYLDIRNTTGWGGFANYWISCSLTIDN